MSNDKDRRINFQNGFIGTIIFLVLAFSLSTDVFAGDVLVICNKEISRESLSREEVKQIFLGRKTRWDDDRKIKFVTLKSGNAHTKFVKQYVHKTPSQFRVFWKKMIFTGKGRAPKSFAAPDELISYVEKTPGAIGYVPAGTVHEKVKVISVN